jgi:pSer/pThr/pTyr-binding forkhead associated (FHA) protein
MITIIILSLLTAFILIGWFVARRRKRAERSSDSIPLFVVPSTSPPHIPRPNSPLSRAARSTAPDGRGSAGRVDHAEQRAARSAPASATIRTREGAVSMIPLAPHSDEPTDEASDEASDPDGDAVESSSIRYWRPADGTLQFLPGRLEIAAGRDVGQEIRFVRTAGPDGARVTFGRAEGAPYRHVQLREPTVSRAHAEMTFHQAVPASNGSGSRGTSGTPAYWRLENLSSTNPVTVNGRALDALGGVGASVILADGDRIEMGEVAFIFHSR